MIKTVKSLDVVLAIAAVLLTMVAGLSGRPWSIGGAGSAEIRAVHAESVAPRPAVQPAAIPGICGAGAYVSGDMVGEASPAAVYTTMCSSR